LRFHWRQKLYEMTVLAFGVGLGPRIFTKLMKVSLTILRRMMIKIIAYLDDSLTIEGEQGRDTTGTEPRLHNKLGEISSNTHTSDRISGNDDKQSDNENLAPRGEDTRTNKTVHPDSAIKDYKSKTTSQYNREALLHHSRNFNSTFTDQSPSIR